ncbi:hypothetical protein OHB00_49865 [Streptomyces sp. NBC_00631]
MATATSCGAVPASPPGRRAAPRMTRRHHRAPGRVYAGTRATTASRAGE